jgi:hypothetical protein
MPQRVSREEKEEADEKVVFFQTTSKIPGSQQAGDFFHFFNHMTV